MADSGVEHALLREPNVRATLRKVMVSLSRLLVAVNLGRASTRQSDLEMMPDHLKRDMGLADGLGPRHDDSRFR